MNEIVLHTDDVLLRPDAGQGFSWRAVFAGAFVAGAVILFLLLLGSGVGLSLFSFAEATANTGRKALTGGGVYLMAALAFGFAVGGYLAGRLMGPQLESEDEELFQATSHGLVAWAVGVVMTAIILGASGVVLTAAGMNAAAIWGSANTSNPPSSGLTPGVAGYWVDTLFRPASGLAQGQAPGAAGAPQPAAAPASGVAAPVPGEMEARAEVARILTVGLASGGQLSQPDRDRIASLLSRYAVVDASEATRRVDDVQNRIHQQEVTAAENARRIAKTVSLWLAASLIFSALVSSAAAVSGRWNDDRARGVP
jgi:hypothetical protein